MQAEFECHIVPANGTVAFVVPPIDFHVVDHILTVDISPALVAPYSMQTTRVTRSTVLGKRGHQEQASPLPSKPVEQLHTPESTPNPKRPRTISVVIDGEGNKENIPPFKLDAVNAETSPVSARAARAIRRTSTMVITPRVTRPGKSISFHVLD